MADAADVGTPLEALALVTYTLAGSFEALAGPRRRGAWYAQQEVLE